MMARSGEIDCQIKIEGNITKKDLEARLLYQNLSFLDADSIIREDRLEAAGELVLVGPTGILADADFLYLEVDKDSTGTVDARFSAGGGWITYPVTGGFFMYCSSLAYLGIRVTPGQTKATFQVMYGKLSS